MSEQRIANLCCSHLTCQREVAQVADRYEKFEKLHAQAEILLTVAAWAEQPDEPTGTYGWISSSDLKMRAAALRTEADVFYRKDGS